MLTYNEMFKILSFRGQPQIRRSALFHKGHNSQWENLFSLVSAYLSDPCQLQNTAKTLLRTEEKAPCPCPNGQVTILLMWQDASWWKQDATLLYLVCNPTLLPPVQPLVIHTEIGEWCVRGRERTELREFWGPGGRQQQNHKWCLDQSM